MSAPRVAAVTLNWHDVPRTLACLRSLTGEPGVGPVIAVDNESDGELARAVDSAGLPVAVMPLAENRGFAGGMNPGLEAALAEGADYILVINNDAVLEPAGLAALVEAIEADPSLGAVAPAILNPDGTTQTLGVRWRLLGAVLEQRKTLGPVDSLTWACVLVRASALREVGLLDERFFMYWEDFELSRRLTDRGWRLAVVPRAVVRHAASSSRDRAGSLLASYHVWGLLVLARIRPGKDRWFARVRLGALLAKRLVLADVPGVRAIWRGVAFARRDGKAYVVRDRPAVLP